LHTEIVELSVFCIGVLSVQSAFAVLPVTGLRLAFHKAEGKGRALLPSPGDNPGQSAEVPFVKIRGLRWWVLTLVFLAAVLNYVDRQTLSALAPTIQRDLGMDDAAYANVVNIFLVAYTLSYLVAGRIADRMGTRVGMVIFVAWWSIANMLTAASQGVRSLGVYRFMLGLGEAGVWPAASKAVSEWFPARERALAIGIYTMGATIGATVAPYIVIPLGTFPYAEKLPILHSMLGQGTGWRVAFIITGAVGLVWLLPWLMLYRQPRMSRFTTETELRLIEGSDSPEAAANDTAADKPWTWRQILTFKATWLLLFGRLITDSAWYFYQFWFPKYLNTERDVQQEALTITWVVYAAAGVGSLFGGWLSGRLIRRGVAPASSRMWVMLGCACVLPLSPVISRVAGLNSALIITVLVVMAALAWLINISAIIVDVVPRHSLGTVFSVVAAGSTVGGILMNTIVAAMLVDPGVPVKPGGFIDQALRTVLGGVIESVQGKGYGLWFTIMAFLHPLAWLMLWFGGVHRPCRVRPAN
jgi:MFS transporter, ACS family, hexuronate transporter